MNLTHTEEQEDLRASVRRLLADKAPGEAARRWMDAETGHDPDLWKQMAAQLGLTGLAVPEEYGGAGYGLAELGVVLEETGRAVLPSPLFATAALAGQAITASEDPGARSRWLPGIADGSLTATLALTEEPGGCDPATVTTRAVPAGGGWALSGTKMFVVDGATADLLLVTARDDGGPALFAVDTRDATVGTGLVRVALDTLDPTRRLARLGLDGVPATRVGPAGAAAAGYLNRVLDLAVTALAHEQAGGAAACLEDAVEYAKTRVQFGRPIGSFQAIKHKCAEVLMEVEGARAAALAAAGAADTEPGELPVAAAVAGAFCAQAYTRAAKENIQIHGGIGFTWEHDAHLHLKRAKTSELLFGSPAWHRDRLAGLVGI